MEHRYRTWAQVSKEALRQNLAVLRRSLPSSARMMAVVKADGYGHGAVEVAKTLADGVHWLGVASLEEALHLRQSGLETSILVLGYTPPEQAKTLADMRISQTVYSVDFAKSLSSQATKANRPVDCHLKIDSGMNRLGIPAWGGNEQSCAEAVRSICALPGLTFSGIFTHLARADEISPEADAFTHSQFSVFLDVLDRLAKQGLTFALRHCCNSAGILRYPEMALDMVRAGIALYGISPSPDCAGLCKDLLPAMTLHTTISMVKTVPAGAAVSYGGTYRTQSQDEVLATIGMGYADGLRRSASGRGHVLIGGRLAPIVGRVCMDQCVVNASHIPGVKQGDVVTVVGREGEACLTFQDWAALENTIPYEEVCLVGKRVSRIYV